MEKITVIVPIYNSSKYLPECLDSIINQTYQNLDIILVDDGSTDNSSDIIKLYCQKDKRISSYYSRNRGVSSARNIGINHSKGKYLSFIDSDDTIEPDFISRLYNNIKETNCDIAECDIAYKGNKIPYVKGVLVCDFYHIIKRLYNQKTGIRTTIVMNKLYKKELFKGLRFTVDICNEDEFIIHKLYKKSKNGIVVDNERLYNYRILDNSLVRTFKDRNIRILEVYAEREKYLENAELLNLNKIAELDMIIYLYSVSLHNKNDRICKKLRESFKKAYKNKNYKCSIYKKIKYIIFNIFPNRLANITYKRRTLHE